MAGQKKVPMAVYSCHIPGFSAEWLADSDVLAMLNRSRQWVDDIVLASDHQVIETWIGNNAVA